MAVTNGGKKKRYVCEGGPWHGQSLWLWSKNTMWMEIKGVTGRYMNGKWEELKHDLQQRNIRTMSSS